MALVAALASDVDLLLLDEPTSGLDPLMEAVFRDRVSEERERGRTVLLSSHILAEVEALCDRVSIVRAGRVVDSGTLADLRHLTRTSIQAELADSPNGLAGMAGVHDLKVTGHRVAAEVDTDQLDAVLATLTGIGVRSLVSRPPTLEELFLRHYQREDAPMNAIAGTGSTGPARVAARPGHPAGLVLRDDRAGAGHGVLVREPLSDRRGTGVLRRDAARRTRRCGRWSGRSTAPARSAA